MAKEVTALARQDAPRELSVEKAQLLLAQCKRVDEAKDIKDQALAVATYLRQKKAATSSRDDAFEIALRAERRMGELLATVELSKGGAPIKHGKRKKPVTGSDAAPVTLAELGVSKAESKKAQKLAALPAAEFDGRVEKARIKGKLTASAVLSTTAALDHDSDSWMTPVEYVEKVRRVLGRIDLDPASSSEANLVVKAAKFYTEQDDGLARSWIGHVFLNPPYSQPLVAEFIARLIKTHESRQVPRAVLLVNVATDTAAFQELLARFPVCFVKGRIGFVLPGGTRVEGNRYCQAFFFLGCDMAVVKREFGDVGTIMEKVK